MACMKNSPSEMMSLYSSSSPSIDLVSWSEPPSCSLVSESRSEKEHSETRHTNATRTRGGG